MVPPAVVWNSGTRAAATLPRRMRAIKQRLPGTRTNPRAILVDQAHYGHYRDLSSDALGVIPASRRRATTQADRGPKTCGDEDVAVGKQRGGVAGSRRGHRAGRVKPAVSERAARDDAGNEE